MIFCPIVPYFWTNKNPLKFNWQNPDRYIFQPVEIWLTTQGSLRQTKFFLSLSDNSQSQSSKKKWAMSEFFFCMCEWVIAVGWTIVWTRRVTHWLLMCRICINVYLLYIRGEYFFRGEDFFNIFQRNIFFTCLWCVRNVQQRKNWASLFPNYFNRMYWHCNKRLILAPTQR